MILNQPIYFFMIWHIWTTKTKVLGDIFTHSEKCQYLITDFATASSNFINCTIQNSRPVQLCCSCAKAYNAVIESFELFLKAQTNETSGCDEKLLSQDRLAVFEATINFYQELWSRGQCNNCLENKINPIEPSNTTKEFKKFYSDTSHCLSNLYNSSSKTYDKKVCQMCSSVYFKMNKFYSDLKEASGNGNMCMDIVDAMNITQHLWSNLLHCGKTILTFESPIIILSSLILLFPVAFYGWALKFSKAKSATVLQRNRLSQRFGERWRGRAGSSISS